MSDSIDFRRVAERANLVGIIEADRGPSDGSRKWFCPFHDDRNPSLGITPDGRRFRCWSGSCGASGTALDWVMLRNNVTIVEAARIIDPSLVGPADRSAPVRAHRIDAPHQAPPRPHVEPVEVWRDQAWQAEVDRIVRLAEARLWSEKGRDARQWLRARGIADSTMRLFRVGFVDHDVFGLKPLAVLATRAKPEGRRIWARRGVVIPWTAPGASYIVDEEDDPAAPRWCGCNVRRLSDPDVFAPLPDEPKCSALAGSARGFGYPYGELLPSQVGPPAVVVEGELDSLLGHQQAGHLAHFLTVGGATQEPKPSALEFLDLCPRWLLALDDDEAGTDAARRWRDLARRPVIRARLPWGKDLTDFHVQGGDVAGWVRGEMERFGSIGRATAPDDVGSSDIIPAGPG